MSNSFSRDVLFCRMIGILAQNELDALAAKTVAVPGCGGVGFTHAESLVRMGIGRIKIADFDVFSAENIGRQFGATVHTVGKNKVSVLEERLRSINPSIAIDTFDGVREDNVEQFLDGVDIVCDAIDYFEIAPRRLLYGRARKRNVPVVIAGPVGFGVTLHIFDPQSMSFDDYFDLADDQSEAEMLLNFGTGLNPAQLFRHSLDNQNLDFKDRLGSVLSSTCLLSTAFIGVVALTRLLGRPTALRPVPHIYQFDLAAGRFVELHIPGGAKDIKSRPDLYKS